LACDPAGLPAGMRAERLPWEVRFRTRYLEIGFDLRRPALTYFSWDSDGTGRTQRNLAKQGAAQEVPARLHDYLCQGVRLHAVAGPAVASYAAHTFEGTVSVEGNRVTYALQASAAGQRYHLEWTVLDDRVGLRVERSSERPLRAWLSSAWHLAFDA